MERVLKDRFARSVDQLKMLSHLPAPFGPFPTSKKVLVAWAINQVVDNRHCCSKGSV